MKSLMVAISVLLALAGAGLFHVKYQVAQLADELKEVQKQKRAITAHLHLLQAEWACLNEPSRLEALAQKYLSLAPLTTAQIMSAADMGFEDAPAEKEE
jgi:cell division protein FtsL